ncbi:hypothetical protein Lal_00018645 [Lupinus albus]|nr:hypothetical protein Lal_00018645 [Lupinus albus]
MSDQTFEQTNRSGPDSYMIYRLDLFKAKSSLTWPISTPTPSLGYFCDEVYSAEHKYVDDEIHEKDDINEGANGQFDEVHIFVNALTGVANCRTMKITCSGNTHNFLDIHMTKQIRCKIDVLKPIMVTVADGTKVQISYVVRNISWTIQHTTFTSDIMLIPLGCCDVVLRIE